MDMNQLIEYRNSRNRFCNRLGITLTEVSPGHAKVIKTVTEEDLNPLGYAHGGVYYTMADNAAGSAIAAYGTRTVTLNAQYNYFRSAVCGDTLTAEATETKHGETICVLDVRVTDQTGHLLGTGTFTFYRMQKELDLT